jgi:hypothetical protein
MLSSLAREEQKSAQAGDERRALLDHPLYDSTTSEPLAQLFHSGSAARWRRKQNDYFVPNRNSEEVIGGKGLTSLTAVRGRMEDIHGVDVSWLHHPGKSQGMYCDCERRRANAVPESPRPIRVY